MLKYCGDFRLAHKVLCHSDEFLNRTYGPVSDPQWSPHQVTDQFGVLVWEASSHYHNHASVELSLDYLEAQDEYRFAVSLADFNEQEDCWANFELMPYMAGVPTDLVTFWQIVRFLYTKQTPGIGFSCHSQALWMVLGQVLDEAVTSSWKGPDREYMENLSKEAAPRVDAPEAAFVSIFS